jgi:hypothetical protein
LAYQPPPGQAPPVGYPAPSPGYQPPGAYTQPPYSGPARRPRVWLWILGGCAGLVVLGVVGLIGLLMVSWTALQQGQNGAFNCLPSDFPKYSNQHLQNVSTFTGTGGSSCTMIFDDDAEASVVTSYYAAELNTGDWVVTKNDSANGVLTFQRRTNPRVHGTVAIFGHGQKSRVDVQVITGS